MRKKLVQPLLLFYLLPLASSQNCLRAQNSNDDFAEPPFEDNNEDALRARRAVQAIVTTYRFTCNCVIITSWETYVQPGGEDHEENMAYDITFQVWRPSANVNDTGCYRLVGQNVFERFEFREGGFVRLDPRTDDIITAQSGDVVGYYTRSRLGNDEGIQLHRGRDYSENVVWYQSGNGPVDTSGECPLPVGTGSDRILSSSTNVAPILRIETTIVPCPTPTAQLLPSPTIQTSAESQPIIVTTSVLLQNSQSPPAPTPTSHDGFILDQSTLISSSATPTPIVVLTRSSNSGTSGKVVIGTVLAVIIVIIVLVASAIILVLFFKLRSKRSNSQVEVATNKLDLSNPNYESASLKVVNVERRSDIFSKATRTIFSKFCCPCDVAYTSVHGGQTVVYDSPNDTTEYEMVSDTGDFSGSKTRTPTNNNVIGNALYHAIGPDAGLKSLPQENNSLILSSTTNIKRSTALEDMLSEEVYYEDTTSTPKRDELYNNLKFGEEEEDYWVPASTTAALYSQLSSKQYREIQRGQIRCHTLLGSGQFGEVYKATWSLDHEELELAVKILKAGASDEDRVKFLQEAAIMGQFRHTNVIKLYGVITHGEPISLCMELLQNGDLRKFLQELDITGSKYSDFEETQLTFLKFARDIASGMNYLSKKSFVHRDLAARNILLDKTHTCKIADFGMARDLMDDTYYTSSGGKIPVKWTAPEALLYKKYSTDSDVWSYGMLLFEIWSVGRKPFSNLTNAQVLRLLDKGFCQPPPPGCPCAIYEVMVDCWNPNHQNRPSFHVISQKYLKQPSSRLLQWAPKDDHLSPAVGVCGAPLEEANKLHYDLQMKYSDNYVD